MAGLQLLVAAVHGAVKARREQRYPWELFHVNTLDLESPGALDVIKKLKGTLFAFVNWTKNVILPFCLDAPL